MLKQINENLIFEQGTEPDVLLILFTGFANMMMMNPFEFLQVSGLYNYSRILVRDPTQCLCLRGIGGELDTFQKLLDKISEIKQQLGARRIITIGSSGGSHTAMLVAHLLKADYSHVFAPFPYLTISRCIQQRNWEAMYKFRRTLLKLNFLPTGTDKYYDLRNVLATWNGQTKYYVHVCQQQKRDWKMANYIRETPGITILPYPCDQHTVIRYLAKMRILDKLFDFGQQEKVADLVTGAVELRANRPVPK
jgi:hypothetical protein